MKLNKKAALDLSVNAIVVMVIAFVVLGLILGFTRSIFGFGREKLGEAIGVAQLEAAPTPENPITIADKVSVKGTDTKTISIGVYNTGSGSLSAATLKIDGVKCKPEIPGVVGGSDPYIGITTVEQKIGGGQAAGYKAILNVENLKVNQIYICRLAVVDGGVGETSISKQFFLEVVP